MKAMNLAAASRRPDVRRFAVFLATGGLAAAVNVLSRFGFERLLKHFGTGGDAAYEGAVVLAYLVGMTTAFVLARTFVFELSGRHLHVQFGRFALVNVVALLQVWIVSVALAYHALPAIGFSWYPETVAHVIGVLSPVVSSYYGHKRFSFG
jgi:putative flippase GtrA